STKDRCDPHLGNRCDRRCGDRHGGGISRGCGEERRPTFALFFCQCSIVNRKGGSSFGASDTNAFGNSDGNSSASCRCRQRKHHTISSTNRSASRCPFGGAERRQDAIDHCDASRILEREVGSSS